MKSFRAFALASIVALLGTEDAFAHVIVPGVSGFAGGLLHPLLVPSHAMSIVALALLLSARPAGERHAAIATFAAALAGAVALVALAFQTDQAATGLLVFAAVTGLLTAIRMTLPLLIAMSLAALVALALQFDSVPATISVSETLLTLAGAALAGLAELALITAAAARATQHWQRIAVRILGSWITAIALLLLALQLR